MNKYSYKGQIIIAFSKDEAIQKIIASSTNSKIDMKVVNKWMKKNLDLTDKGLGKDHWKNPKTGEVYYTWNAAKRLAKKVGGYHLPTVKEWNELIESFGCVCTNPKEKNPNLKKYDDCRELKKKLNIKLRGFYDERYHSGLFNVGSWAMFWTNTEYGGTLSYSVAFNKEDYTHVQADYKNDIGLSVRLVKD